MYGSAVAYMVPPSPLLTSSLPARDVVLAPRLTGAGLGKPMHVIRCAEVGFLSVRRVGVGWTLGQSDTGSRLSAGKKQCDASHAKDGRPCTRVIKGALEELNSGREVAPSVRRRFSSAQQVRLLVLAMATPSHRASCCR